MVEAQAPILPQFVGVLNVTPDSFSDTGKFLAPEEAIRKSYELREEGADIIDVGAESSGTHSKSISVDEEWDRLEPVLKTICREFVVSVDTYKAEIARRALDYGASIINDISGLRADPDMVKVVARAGSKVIIMHSKEQDSSPHVSEWIGSYKDVVADISSFLKKRVQFAIDNGVKPENIILDPGLGLFLSQDPKYSWELLKRTSELSSLKLPILMGVSRKNFLKLRNESDPSERDPISALIGVHLVEKGVRYLRTHNVKMTKTFLETWHNLN